MSRVQHEFSQLAAARFYYVKLVIGFYVRSYAITWQYGLAKACLVIISVVLLDFIFAASCWAVLCFFC
jgi:hypothetical protein